MTDIFISYSHQDEHWKDTLQKQLRVLERQGELSIWEDRQIKSGTNWLPEIEKAIANARVAVLLVSSDFLTSDFVLREEIPKLLQRRKQGGLRVIPVLLRPCYWQAVPWLAEIQGATKDNLPLSRFLQDEHGLEEAITGVVGEVFTALQESKQQETLQREARLLAEQQKRLFVQNTHIDLEMVNSAKLIWSKYRAENLRGRYSFLVLPRLSLLEPPPPARKRVSQTKTSLNPLSEALIDALEHYGLKSVEVVASDPGPVITRFELRLPDAIKVGKVSAIVNDLAHYLSVPSVRVLEANSGRPTIGIEIPNKVRDEVVFSEIIISRQYKDSRLALPLALGKDIAGRPVVVDLARMPHLLLAGRSGSGKSMAINTILLSLLYKATPEEVRLILVDPNMLGLSYYEGIPHLLTPVVTDMQEAVNVLSWSVAEVERRYLMMSKLKVRNILGFNQKVCDREEIPDPLFDPLKSTDMNPDALQPLPYIVIVIDEFADVMIAGKKVEELIVRLAKKARTVGIHLILSTRHTSVNVITGLIKAYIPTRIAFKVSTSNDSRSILDQEGAEKLLDFGDMLYMPPGASVPQRLHGSLVTDVEVEDVGTYVKQQLEAPPRYLHEILDFTDEV